MHERQRSEASPIPGVDRDEDGRFTRRLLIILLTAALALAGWWLSDVVILAFGAVILALVLRGLARLLARRTGLSEDWAVVPVVLVLLLATTGVVWLFGTQISVQFDLLAEDLPESATRLLRDLSSRPWGAWLLSQAQDVSLSTATGPIAARIGALFTSVFRIIAYLAVLIFAGIYLAAQPDRYRESMLRLVPANRRARIGEVLDIAGETLRRWMIGQFLTMVVVGTLTGIGLWLLGIGAPLALGLIAGAFAFVPYVGPLLASAPGILMAATQGPMPALYAAFLYGAVHAVEGNLITPLIQAEVVELPPVTTIFATLIFSLLLGPVGILLAAPLTVVLLTAVNCLYIENVLGERRVWPRQGGAHG